MTLEDKNQHLTIFGWESVEAHEEVMKTEEHETLGGKMGPFVTGADHWSVALKKH